MESDSLIGRTIGPYKVLEKIGQGGMAEIYKGIHPELGRYVAIKLLGQSLQTDPTFARQFQREAQAIASLRHPNIIQVFDFGQKNGGHYLVMEYIEGSDLREEINRRFRDAQPFTPDEIVHILAQVADAIDYAHEHGIIHRDVKPGNILLTKAGQAILTDFGLAMLRDRVSQITLGHAFGTPEYIAPEQAMDSRATVPQSDIYALGAILYEMVTSHLPFEAESALSLALKHIGEDPAPPSQHVPNLPPAVEAVILRALAKDPEARQPTARALIAELRAAWTGAPAQPTIPIPVASQRRAHTPFTPPPPPPTPSPAPTLLVAPPEPEEEVEEETPPTPKRRRGLGTGILVTAFLVALGLFLSSRGIGPLAVAFATATATSTATPTATPRPSRTPTPTSTPITPTRAAVAPAASPSATPTRTPAPSPTPTRTPAPSPTPTRTPTPSPTPTLAPATTYVRPGDGMTMHFVPAGPFTMGSAADDAYPHEQPAHTVTLSAFWIDETEVTTDQYRLCVEAGGCAVPNSRTAYDDPAYANHPMVYVTWEQADAYCLWLAGETGWPVHLPTEAQWEKAASWDAATGAKHLYPWGDAAPTADLLNYLGSGLNRTTVTGNYPAGASPYGALDMAGNVWEWVADWYGANYYAASEQAVDPQGPASGSQRVMRGGSYGFGAFQARTTHRDAGGAGAKGGGLGFRCAVDGEQLP
ncbi:MAG: SUMF1/EgtB/PvdO family nonheme iron enzyme [Anaerolineae bacterium]|nr:SUMF1/EgtB/PvdO family nonheme iron enzyme [Anaerolineae bacterium]